MNLAGLRLALLSVASWGGSATWAFHHAKAPPQSSGLSRTTFRVGVGAGAGAGSNDANANANANANAGSQLSMVGYAVGMGGGGVAQA
eukprot:CAMPEP_0113564240 /NCGR_PEP_ID=MMETSP0015_2-20120614/21511_1 /TAXON_ID=2838 /ORGANISM="Odontella" /LENGTH=87 /DNA_ID=CAMNT_0000466303 /DNA_START=242 /DNA_END=502 /DNA_ORIENTATION=- /assembly_acc=CAM_ASM_000160